MFMSLWNQAINDFTVAIQLKSDFHEAYGGRAFSYYKSDDADLAMRDYNAAVSLYEDHLYYNGRGVIYFERKEFKEALKDFDKVIEIYPSYSYAYLNRALVCMAFNQSAEAHQNLNAATALGLDIASAFRETFDSIDDFTRKFGIDVPDSIRLLLG